MKLSSETIAQIQVCDWICQKTNLRFYHFVQEGERGFVNVKILHRMGMKAGVSDLFFPRSSGKYKGLWLELKTGKNKPTAAQSQFLQDMIEEGYMSICVWEAESAIQFIKTFYEIH